MTDCLSDCLTLPNCLTDWLSICLTDCLSVWEFSQKRVQEISLIFSQVFLLRRVRKVIGLTESTRNSPEQQRVKTISYLCCYVNRIILCLCHEGPEGRMSKEIEGLKPQSYRGAIECVENEIPMASTYYYLFMFKASIAIHPSFVLGSS